MNRSDWLWSLGTLAVCLLLSAASVAALRALFSEVRLHPPFMSMEPLTPGRFRILAAWLPFWVLVGWRCHSCGAEWARFSGCGVWARLTELAGAACILARDAVTLYWVRFACRWEGERCVPLGGREVFRSGG